MILRGNSDFPSLEEYQCFIDLIVNKINSRCQIRLKEERTLLNPLPKRRTHDYAEHRVLVTSSSTFVHKRVTYSVPSRFINESLYAQVYDSEIKLFLGHEQVFELPRIYAANGQRALRIDYRHLIGTLIKKPQAFRYSQLRDSILPSPDYQQIWQYADESLPAHDACRYIVRLLNLAAKEDCEGALGRYVLRHIDKGMLPSELQCSKHFSSGNSFIPSIVTIQHCLGDYDQLLGPVLEVSHG